MTLSAIEVHELPEQHTATIRQQFPVSEASRIPTLLGQTLEAVRASGVEPAGMPFVRSFSMSDAELDVEVGWPLATRFTGDGDVQASTLPGGPAAVASYFGLYEGLAGAYEAIRAWCAEHGHLISGWPWESYSTDPNDEPDPAKWRTDIHFPLVE